MAAISGELGEDVDWEVGDGLLDGSWKLALPRRRLQRGTGRWSRPPLPCAGNLLLATSVAVW